jgi:DNA-binding XRE family transcriptional regulator
MTLVASTKCTLEAARQALDMSSTALAKAAGVARATINCIERHDNNGYPVTIDVAIGLCRPLKKDISEILWPHGLTERPKRSGSDRPARQSRIPKICPGCHYELPPSGRCQSDSCVE